MFKKISLVVAGLVATASTASAAIDLTGPTASVTDGVAAIGTLGGLVLGALVLARSFKWVRAAM